MSRICLRQRFSTPRAEKFQLLFNIADGALTWFVCQRCQTQAHAGSWHRGTVWDEIVSSHLSVSHTASQVCSHFYSISRGILLSNDGRDGAITRDIKLCLTACYKGSSPFRLQPLTYWILCMICRIKWVCICVSWLTEMKDESGSVVQWPTWCHTCSPPGWCLQAAALGSTSPSPRSRDTSGTRAPPPGGATPSYRRTPPRWPAPSSQDPSGATKSTQGRKGEKNKSIAHGVCGKLHMTAELMWGPRVIRSQNDSCVKTD